MKTNVETVEKRKLDVSSSQLPTKQDSRLHHLYSDDCILDNFDY